MSQKVNGASSMRNYRVASLRGVVASSQHHGSSFTAPLIEQASDIAVAFPGRLLEFSELTSKTTPRLVLVF